MAKPIPRKKSEIARQIPRKSRAQAKGKKRKALMVPQSRGHGWITIGWDISLSSIAAAAMGYDRTLDRLVGPAFVMRRFEKDDHYFSRIEMAVRVEDMIDDLKAELKSIHSRDEIYIAVEEPFPPGNFVRRGQSNALKQQAEMSGAFLGGLLRSGFKNIHQIGNHLWRQHVANGLHEELGIEISIHHSKWKDPKLCERFNCKPDDTGKFRAKQWALDVFAPWAGQRMGVEILDWPDMITRDGRKVPRPEDSVAKAFQPDDRYDALAIMDWLRWDLLSSGEIFGG